MQKANVKPKWPKHIFAVINEPVNIIEPRKKILIMIPSKDRNDLLFQCINSIITHTHVDIANVQICIIDTGSTETNIDEINRQLVIYKDSHINVCMKKHGFYNFSKNNNQAFKEMNGASYDYVVLCNNDIKFLNDVLSRMLWTFENEKQVGSVGARLHFEDGKIQHIGAHCTMNRQNGAQPGHFGFGQVITGAILAGSQAVPANTAGLLMMSAALYAKYQLSEEYNECYEDVQLNLTLVANGYINYCNLSAVAFHYESQTRNTDPKKQEKQNADLIKLSNFVNKHRENQFIKSICYIE